MKKIIVTSIVAALAAVIGYVILSKTGKQESSDDELQIDASPLVGLAGKVRDKARQLRGSVKDAICGMHGAVYEADDADWDDPRENCVNRITGIYEDVCGKGVQHCPFMGK